MAAPVDPLRAAASPDVVVWWATRRPLDELDLAPLSSEERARVERLATAAGRERSALARVLLRAALADALGADARTAEVDWSAGPRLVGSGGPELSLSHSGERVVVALSTGGAVGVDIELADRGERLRHSVVEKISAPAELAAIEGLAPGGARERASIELWTAKEAVLKATRDGLQITPSSVELADWPSATRLMAHASRPELVGACSVRALTLDPGYVGTLAVLSSTASAVEERDGDALLAS